MNKKLILATLFSCTALFFTSCDDDDDNDRTIKITFENAQLNENGVFYTQSYVENNYSFANNYTEAYDSWDGFAISNNVDTKTEGYTNQYSVYAGVGANNSQKFAVAYSGLNAPSFAHTDSAEFAPQSAYFALTTYTYLSTQNGDAFAKKFAEGDYYRVNVKGISATTDTTEITFDAINIDNNVAFTTWQKVDLRELGNVVKIEISFESSDNGYWGMNTPAYIAIDDIEIVEK